MAVAYLKKALQPVGRLIDSKIKQLFKDFIMLLPVIMAGGTGSRLWPMSRETVPPPVRAELHAAGNHHPTLGS